MEIEGASGRYLLADCGSGEVRSYMIDDKDQRLYLGGKGLAVKIYYDLTAGAGAFPDPLAPENPLIFSLGVLLGSRAPCSARFELLTRSPLTGLLVGSSCGGPFGEALRTAGWDGLILTGRAARPSVLRIDAEGAGLDEAEELWGLDTEAAQRALELSAKQGAAVIGPAGENLVRYANIRSGHRFAGRGGVGAVMGSKNLKAVVATGFTHRVRPARPALLDAAAAKAKKQIDRNPMTLAYRAYGTAANVRPGIRAGYSPVRNFRDRFDPRTEATLGEAMAERYSTRHSTCRHCTIRCGHKGRFPDGAVRQIPEYETVGMFGSNIGNFDPDLIGVWNERMNALGIDTISAGGTIAWAMEAAEKGMRPSRLAFGSSDEIGPIIEDIAFRRGEGDELAQGSRALSERYGGGEFAIQVKGLECAAYDPRSAWGQGLSYAVYNKGGCHLGSYLIGLERLLGYMPPHTTLGKASWTVFCEDLYAAINSLQICQFTTYGILTEPPIPRFVPRALLKAVTVLTPGLSQALMDWSVLSRLFSGLTGIPMSKGEFRRAGERITKLERWLNLKMSDSAADDTLPARFTAEKQTAYPGRQTVVPIEPMVRAYYRLRRYTPSGAPREDELEKLMEEKLCRT